jgi:hypothetical protein
VSRSGAFTSWSETGEGSVETGPELVAEVALSVPAVLSAVKLQKPQVCATHRSLKTWIEENT